MATSLSRRLEELVMCPICYEQFEDPRVLPCLHTYCKRCLEILLAGGTTISCPECRKTVEIQDVNELKVNFQTNNITSLLGDKQITAITLKPTFCQKHQEALKLFCETCEQLICCECIVVDHNGHQFGYLEEITKTRKADLTKLIKPGITLIEQVKTMLNEQLMPDNVTLKQQDTGITQEDEVVINDIVMNMTSLESIIEFTKKTLTRGSDSEIVSLYTQVIPQLHDMFTILKAQAKGWEELASTRREPIDPEVPSSHEKSSAGHPRPTSMVEEWEVERNGERVRSSSFSPAIVIMLKQLERIGPEVESPQENMMNELHTVNKDPKSRSSEEKLQSPRPLPPIPMAKGKESERRKVDRLRPYSTSFAEVAMHKQAVDSKVLNHHENMMNEFHTVSKDHESRNPAEKPHGERVRSSSFSPAVVMMLKQLERIGPEVESPQENMMNELHTVSKDPESRSSEEKLQSPRLPPPPIPMAKGKGLERRKEDVRPPSTLFADVVIQRQGPQENRMNEFHSVSKDPQSRSQGKCRAPRPPPPPIPMTKEKELERSKEDRLRSSCTSYAGVARQRQAVESKVINPREIMMKELHTAINKSGSRNPTGEQPSTSPMARKTGQEKKNGRLVR